MRAIHLLRRLRARDRESGVGPARLSALSVLVIAGPHSPGELAEAEQVRPPTMTRIVSGLERAGLVRGTVSRRDRRRLLIQATEKGKRAVLEARRRRVESLARALAVLTPREIRELRAAAELMERIGREI